MSNELCFTISVRTAYWSNGLNVSYCLWSNLRGHLLFVYNIKADDGGDWHHATSSTNFLSKQPELYVQVIPTACCRKEAEEKKYARFCKTRSFDLAAWVGGIFGQATWLFVWTSWGSLFLEAQGDACLQQPAPAPTPAPTPKKKLSS